MYEVSGYTKDVIADAAYRLRLPCENSSFELTGSLPAASYFTLDEIRQPSTAQRSSTYEDTPDGSSQKTRV